VPMYYSINRETSTNGSANTRSPHLLALTGSGVAARIVGVYGSCQSGTAGGASLLLDVADTSAGSGGTAGTELKRNPSYPSATTVLTTDASAITPGSTLQTHVAVGLAQTGGMGGWVALEPDHALALRSGGGANGNCEVASKANGTSITLRATLEWAEY
jgi:hypothetical protein